MSTKDGHIDYRIYSQEVKAFLLLMLGTPPDPEVRIKNKQGRVVLDAANTEFLTYINKARGLLKMRIPISYYTGHQKQKKRIRDIRAVTAAFKSDLLQTYWDDKQKQEATKAHEDEESESARPRYNPLKLSVSYWLERERQKALDRLRENDEHEASGT